jgi:hypothetical protein
MGRATEAVNGADRSSGNEHTRDAQRSSEVHSPNTNPTRNTITATHVISQRSRKGSTRNVIYAAPPDDHPPR